MKKIKRYIRATMMPGFENPYTKIAGKKYILNSMKISIKFTDLQNQYKLIKNEIDAAIKSVLDDSVFIGGKYLKEFEINFAKYLNLNHCVML